MARVKRGGIKYQDRNLRITAPVLILRGILLVIERRPIGRLHQWRDGQPIEPAILPFISVLDPRV